MRQTEHHNNSPPPILLYPIWAVECKKRHSSEHWRFRQYEKSDLMSTHKVCFADGSRAQSATFDRWIRLRFSVSLLQLWWTDAGQTKKLCKKCAKLIADKIAPNKRHYAPRQSAPALVQRYINGAYIIFGVSVMHFAFVAFGRVAALPEFRDLSAIHFLETVTFSYFHKCVDRVSFRYAACKRIERREKKNWKYFRFPYRLRSIK